MRVILLIALLSLSGCKFPDIELKFVDIKNDNVRVFVPNEDGSEFQDTGVDLPIESLQDHFCLSSEDFVRWRRYYQRQCIK